MKKHKSFSKRLVMNIALIVSAVFIICIGVLAISSHYLLSEEATKSARNLLNATMANIEKELQVVEQSAEDAVWIVEEHRDDSNYMYHITERLVNDNPIIVGSAIAFRPEYYAGKHYFAPCSNLNEDGSIVSKQLGSSTYDYFYMDFYQLPTLLGKPCWTEPYYDEGGGNRFISTYSYPIRDAQGEIYAVITADIDLKWISDIINGIHPYKNSYMILLSKAGNFIGYLEDAQPVGVTIFSYLKSTLDDPRAYEAAKAMINGEDGMTQYRIGRNLNFSIYGHLSNGWSASIICQYKEVLARNSRMHLILILVGLLGLAILFSVCYLIIRQLTKPLLDFTEAAQNIAQGDFNTTLPEIKSDDEIRMLRDSFDDMQQSIIHQMKEIEEKTAANARYSSELNIASEIQKSLLTTNFPHNGDIDIHAFLQPAKEVGGDLYDFEIHNGKLYFAIGDVSGKGVPAAIFMAIMRSALRFFAGLGLTLGENMRQINNAISDNNKSEMFITLFIGRLDLTTGVLQYCNAGHNPLIVIDPQGEASFLNQKPNIAVGVFPGFTYEAQEITLPKGSSLVLYTDGITEAERADKAQFGDQRLLDWANQAKLHEFNAEQMVNDLCTTVNHFTDGNEQNDDITVMIIKS